MARTMRAARYVADEEISRRAGKSVSEKRFFSQKSVLPSCVETVVHERPETIIVNSPSDERADNIKQTAGSFLKLH